MSSGRRESVMLFCISPISKMYLEPIAHYEPDIIHVFIGNREDAVSTISREIYRCSKDDIVCKKIVEHQVDDSNYNELLAGIIDTLNGLNQEYGKDMDVFINISSGTPEFSAAGMFASMLPLSAIAFKVDVQYGLQESELSDLAGRLNASASISEPERVTGLKNDSPDDEMVVFLRIVNDLLNETRYPKYRKMIDRLKQADAWSYDPDRKSGYGRTSLEEKEERYLKRHYIAIALENGWLERPSDRTLRLTDSGSAYISVFGQEVCGKPKPSMKMNALHSMPEDVCRCEELIMDNDLEDLEGISEESNEVTFVSRDRRYTFRIEMDQHYQHSGHH